MPTTRDHSKLFQELATEYTKHSPRSAALNERAQQTMIDGGSHTLRLIKPFPPRLVRAQGAYIHDADGHSILDFWQGHYTNILGHNPKVITDALARAFESGWGLQTGFTDELQIQVAELICKQTQSERVRFTTSGALATMNAIMLARAFTGRDLVLKVGGGWHGGQPWGLVGVNFAKPSEPWRVEGQGLPSSVANEVIVTRYNRPDILRAHFEQYGNRLACFIVEPFMGAGGFMPATREYLRTARELCDHYGVVLIFDEVISGFRFCAGTLGVLYGVQPDLTTLAKIIGGGMPVAAVAGRAAILQLCGRAGGNRVRFAGGTYSAHPASMLAAKTLLTYLVEHENEIYPRLAQLGAQMRQAIEDAFLAEGIFVRCTGHPNDALGGSSFAVPQFPYDEKQSLDNPDDVNNPSLCDVELRDHIFQLALLLEDVHVVHGGGAVSTAHTEQDIARLGEAARRVAQRIKKYL
ncbi:MAG: aminotransferase class III-fold pyridoxal phosphate-dependent enzyme [Anaerolineae bacterium]|nr:aminotransferase class III-fold pyridoxal phosphate-dependent enzyme [Anaerolineae bacterium]